MTLAEKWKVKLVDREDKLSQRYMRRMVAWVAEHGTEGTDLNALLGTISPIPRALVGGDGLPYKGTKSNTTTCLKHRYSEPPVISDILPSGWVPDVVILEGMFLIHTPPLTTMTCMRDYVRLLLSRFIQPHFSSGANEDRLVRYHLIGIATVPIPIQPCQNMDGQGRKGNYKLFGRSKRMSRSPRRTWSLY